MATTNYTILETSKTNQGTKYIFTSKGKTDIVKAIQYSYVQEYNNKQVYNLGFGDYNMETGETDDIVLTDNGDTYVVFNTVLTTKSMFFEAYPNDMMIVQGSDSAVKFSEKCRQTCKRKCIDVCKKAHRRIGVYREYVNRNFDELNKEYKFYGGILSVDNKIIIEDYIEGKTYQSVLVIKNNV